MSIISISTKEKKKRKNKSKLTIQTKFKQNNTVLKTNKKKIN